MFGSAVFRFAGIAGSNPFSSMAIFVFNRCVRAYGLSWLLDRMSYIECGVPECDSEA